MGYKFLFFSLLRLRPLKHYLTAFINAQQIKSFSARKKEFYFFFVSNRRT